MTDPRIEAMRLHGAWASQTRAARDEETRNIIKALRRAKDDRLSPHRQLLRGLKAMNQSEVLK